MSAGNINSKAWIPGQIWTEDEDLVSLESRPSLTLWVKNTGDRPIQVGSHFHFFEVNKALEFPRQEAWGFRMAIPAGTAMRFEPGMEYEIPLMALGGERVVFGLNGLVKGSLDDPKIKLTAIHEARRRGFKGV